MKLPKPGFLIALVLSIPSVSSADIFRLDFIGVLTHIASSEVGDYSDSTLLPSSVDFSGHLAFDLTTPVGFQSETTASYFNMTVSGGLAIDSIDYFLDTSDSYVNSTLVANGADVGGNIFSSYNQFIDSGGNTLIFGVIFQSQSMDWLDGLNIPGSFSLEDVDPFDVTSPFSTQGLIFASDGYGSFFEYGAFTSSEFRPVPLPGALMLMTAALGVLVFGHRKV